MISPALDGIYCVDSPEQLSAFWPDDPADFVTYVGFTVKDAADRRGVHGTVHFDITVCTAKWLERRVAADRGVTSGQDELIVAEPDLRKVKGYIELRLSRCAGEDWDEVARQIAQMGPRQRSMVVTERHLGPYAP